MWMIILPLLAVPVIGVALMKVLMKKAPNIDDAKATGKKVVDNPSTRQGKSFGGGIVITSPRDQSYEELAMEPFPVLTKSTFTPIFTEIYGDVFNKSPTQDEINAAWETIERESGGACARPNFTYGPRSSMSANPSGWASVVKDLRDGKATGDRFSINGGNQTYSTACGLFQALDSNVKAYYPSGIAGLGNPIEEVTGFVKYVKARHDGDFQLALSRQKHNAKTGSGAF